MTPAQRRKKLRDFRRKKTSKKISIFVLFVLFVFFVIVGFYFFGKKNYLSGLNNSLVFTDRDGNIVVSIFDKKRKEITSVYIPSNTQLEVSRQLGSWKAKSIWELGINEKYDGKLLQETVIKNFHFPVNIWADEKASGFTSNNFIKILKAAFIPYKSNLSLGDRLNLFLVSFGIQNEKVSSYDLSELGILKKVKLTDGEEGYLVLKDIPIHLMSSFSEPSENTSGHIVQIVNATGSRYIAENIGKTVEAMGLKVTAIKEETLNDYDCLVSGKDKNLVKKLSLIYTCDIEEKENDDFDIVIKVGSRFSKRF